MDKIKDAISKNLAEWMSKSASLDSLKKVASRADVGFGTVQRMRNGDANVTIKNLSAVAAAFGKTAIDLMTIADHDAEYQKPVTPVPQRVAEVLQMPAPSNERERLIQKINEALPALSEYGLVAVLEKSKDAERDYPVVKQTLM